MLSLEQSIEGTIPVTLVFEKCMTFSEVEDHKLPKLANHDTTYKCNKTHRMNKDLWFSL